MKNIFDSRLYKFILFTHIYIHIYTYIYIYIYIYKKNRTEIPKELIKLN